MGEKPLDALSAITDSLVEAYRKNSVFDFVAYLFKLRSLMDEIIRRVFPGESYETLRISSMIGVTIKMRSMSERIGRLYTCTYEIVHAIERLTDILSPAKSPTFEKGSGAYVHSLLRGLQNLSSYLKDERPLIEIMERPSTIVGRPEIKPEELLLTIFMEKVGWAGEWFREVPVGLSGIRKELEDLAKKERIIDFSKVVGLIRQLKRLDLVFVESVLPINHGELIDPTFYLTTPMFDNKQVILIEAETSANTISNGVKQLIEYKTLFQSDWPKAKIKKLVLISPEWTKETIKQCDDNKIEGWEISYEGISKVTKD
jgi:hypothetical protein